MLRTFPKELLLCNNFYLTAPNPKSLCKVQRNFSGSAQKKLCLSAALLVTLNGFISVRPQFLYIPFIELLRLRSSVAKFYSSIANDTLKTVKKINLDIETKPFCLRFRIILNLKQCDRTALLSTDTPRAV